MFVINNKNNAHLRVIFAVRIPFLASNFTHQYYIKLYFSLIDKNNLFIQTFSIHLMINEHIFLSLSNRLRLLNIF